jgi:hypothetical protein
MTREVNVAPSQRQELAEAQACVGSDTNQLGVLMVLGTHRCANLVSHLKVPRLAVPSVSERSGERLYLLR